MSVSGRDIYVDLGVDNAEKALKYYICIVIKSQIIRLGLSQTRAAVLIGTSQPDVCKLMRGQPIGYSLERLFAFARALGSDVEISIKAAPAVRDGLMRLSVEMEAA